MKRPKFKIGEKVVINPLGSMGMWTHVDLQLDNRGIAVITSRHYVMPSNGSYHDDDVKCGCPEDGYWEYALRFFRASKFNRPRYGIAESFLFHVGSRGHKMTNRYYDVKRKNEVLWSELKHLEKELTSVTDSLSKTKTIRSY